MTRRLLQRFGIACCLLVAACSAVPPVPPAAMQPEPPPGEPLRLAAPALPSAPAGPAPTWPELRDLTYPSSITADGWAPLQNGVYRERAERVGGVGEVLVSLGDLAVFADLNGDQVDEATVLLVEAPGGGDLHLSLAVVARMGAELRPIAVASLGPGVVIEAVSADDGDLIVQALRPAPGDPLCCPGIHATVRLQLRDHALVVVERVETQRRAPTLPDPAALTPFRLAAPNGGRVAVDGLVGPGAVDAYLLQARTGQELRIAVESTGGAAFLGLIGPDGVAVSAVEQRARAWQGRLAGGGDYVIAVGADANTTYTLQAELVAPPAPGSAFRPQSGAERVVYLTFDDGPHPLYTPQVLDLLARYNARATFFVLGRNAEAHPELLRAISAAGHAVANHSYSHPALAGIGREAFLREVGGAQQLLGPGASRCFRPPYGSLDANTYAYAAELGLQVVLWDVDPQDWALPGAGAIAARVLANTGPGSIVLFHDGGGERSQTVAALATVLAELSAQGYRFAALQC